MPVSPAPRRRIDVPLSGTDDGFVVVVAEKENVEFSEEPPWLVKYQLPGVGS